ncbi:TetR/AcrR family transcriptional regulator [Streptomyces sp. DSM 41014]|uniref:TetR/AcrR family transcriptional regulator n=1 Tax=Streptomyces hintoniae TaxID=3075521 RepID=A0ABU2ULF1_9ACTN|nr:TetR/AcrR family transcriptional regulator [Streptomyces sp. DSM 41014]MDT0473968.1 TetR/AcrR family transcriptional regulator [Streptomyces sp. DSM 41014]
MSSSPDAGLAPSASGETDRRTLVLDSALLTFARFGYRKTSMEEVARAAHISRPGLYFLFSSKEALFRAAVTQVLERDLAAVERVLADADRPLAERLVEAFDQWAGRYIGPLARDVAVVVDDNPDLLGEIGEAAPRRFEELITDAIAAEPGEGPATPVAQTMISASIGLKHQAATREFYRERLKVAIDLLVR